MDIKTEIKIEEEELGTQYDSQLQNSQTPAELFIHTGIFKSEEIEREKNPVGGDSAESSSLNLKIEDVEMSTSSQMGGPREKTETSNPWPYINKYFEYMGQKGEHNSCNLNYKCLLCKKVLSTNDKSLTNLKRHVSRRHSSVTTQLEQCIKEGVELQRNKKAREPGSGDPDAKKQKTMFQTKEATSRSSRVTKSVFEEKLITFFVNNMLPLDVVDSDSWKDFVSTCVPGQHSMSRMSLTKGIEDRFDEKKKHLKNVLNSVQSVSTTADAWTCGNRSFMGLTVHWINQDTLLRQKAVLACKRLTGRQTFEVLAKDMYKVYFDFAIESKVCRTTTDNGSNFVKAFNVFGKTDEEMTEEVLLDEEESSRQSNDEDVEIENMTLLLSGATEDPQYTLPKHTRCATHTLNLVSTSDADKALKNSPYRNAYRSAFGKAKELWNKQSRSLQASDIIMAEIGIQLTVPTVTRWNSVYDGVSCLIGIFGDRDKLQGLHRACSILGVPSFSSADINFFTEYFQVMEPVYKALDILQGENKAYLGTLLPTLAISLNKLKDQILNSDIKMCQPLILAVRDGIKCRFGLYFKDMDFLLASALHPQFKLSWMKLVETDVIDNMEETTAEVKRQMVFMVERILPESEMCNSSSSEDDNYKKNEEFFDCLYESGEKRKVAGTKLVETFLGTKPIKSSRLNNNLFPCSELKDLFIKFNTPIPSSSAVERLFSLGNDVLKPKRSGLSDRYFETLVFLKGNS